MGGVLLAVALGGLVLAGCGDDDDDVASPSGSASEAPAEGEGAGGEDAAGDTLTVVGTDYAFDGMPATLEGGVVTVEFRNEGEKPHELGMMQLGEELSVEDFDAAVQPVFNGEGFPDVIEGHSGIGEIEPGESVTSTFSLPEGTYAVYCSITDEEEDSEEEGAEGEEGSAEEEAPPHYELGMYQLVTAEGEGSGSLPEGPSIVATDYTFEAEGLEAGEQEVTFRNESPEQFHHVVVFEWPEGTDEAAADEAWKVFAELDEEEEPPEGTPEPEDVAGSQVFGPGSGGTFKAELTSGRTYTFICFVQDRSGGAPHAFAHDMITHLVAE